MKITYTPIGDFLTSLEVTKINHRIEESNSLEILTELPDGRPSHIVKKGTLKPIGYFNEYNRLELVNKDKKKLKRYHNYLIKIYNKVARNSISLLK